MDGKRSFKVLEIRKPAQQTKKHTMKKTTGEGGRYISSTPEGAARKAFTFACRGKKIRGQCTLVLVIQETTAGSEKNVYKFKLKRVKKSTPLVITRGDAEITIKYDVECESLN